MPLYFNGSSVSGTTGGSGSQISGIVYTYQGSVLTAGDLPKDGMKPGDVYNLEDNGMNVAWTGEDWDALGGTFSVDLSGYAETAYVDEQLALKADKTELNNVVKYIDYSYNDEARKGIQLSNYENLVGVDTKGEGHNLAMVSKWDVADLGAPKLHTNLNTKDVITVNDKQAVITDQLLQMFLEAGNNIKIDKTVVTDEATQFQYNKYTVSSTVDISNLATKTEVDDKIAEKAPVFVNIPIRNLQDQVYEKETILGWFGVQDEIGLKKLISEDIQMILKYGISLQTNPHYYKMPIHYAAFESATQVKLVFIGLNTENDQVTKYVIIMNLDGSVIDEGNSNVKMTITSLETTT